MKPFFKPNQGQKSSSQSDVNIGASTSTAKTSNVEANVEANDEAPISEATRDTCEDLDDDDEDNVQTVDKANSETCVDAANGDAYNEDEEILGIENVFKEKL